VEDPKLAKLFAMFPHHPKVPFPKYSRDAPESTRSMVPACKELVRSVLASNEADLDQAVHTLLEIPASDVTALNSAEEGLKLR
jgi:hypothetical protein